MAGAYVFSIGATGPGAVGPPVVRRRTYYVAVGSQSLPPQPTAVIKFHVLDLGHSGGPIEGWTELATCAPATCTPPTVWNVGNPQWDDGVNPEWKLSVDVVNVDLAASHDVHVTTKGGDVHKSLVATTVPGVYTATFTIDPKDILAWYDSMDLTIDGATVKWKLLNVRSLIAPVVKYVSSDSTSWTGQNLTTMFQYLEVDPGTPGVKITCLNFTSCGVNAGAIPKQTGILYIASDAPGVANRVEISLMKLNTNGTLSPISYQSPKDASQTGNTKVIGSDQTPPPAGANPAADTNNQGAGSPAAPITPTTPSATRNAAIMTVPSS